MENHGGLFLQELLFDPTKLQMPDTAIAIKSLSPFKHLVELAGPVLCVALGGQRTILGTIQGSFVFSLGSFY